MRVIDGELLKEFRSPGRCEFCKEWVLRREPHHVHTRGMGSGGRMDIRINLIALCPRDHRSHHDGNSPLTCDLKAVVAAREGRTQLDIDREIAELRRKRR